MLAPMIKSTVSSHGCTAHGVEEDGRVLEKPIPLQSVLRTYVSTIVLQRVKSTQQVLLT